MDIRLFHATRHGREAKGLVLRCLEKLMGCCGAIIGGQTGDPDPAYQAYRQAYIFLETISGWMKFDGQMKLPEDAESFVSSTTAAVEALKRCAQGADPGMATVHSNLESVVVALTELPGYIKLERARLAKP